LVVVHCACHVGVPKSASLEVGPANKGKPSELKAGKGVWVLLLVTVFAGTDPIVSFVTVAHDGSAAVNAPGAWTAVPGPHCAIAVLTINTAIENSRMEYLMNEVKSKKDLLLG